MTPEPPPQGTVASSAALHDFEALEALRAEADQAATAEQPELEPDFTPPEFADGDPGEGAA